MGCILFLNPFQKLLLKLFFAGQVKLILAGMNVGVSGQGNLDKRCMLLLAEDDADGGIFSFRLHEAVEVVDIHLHLAEVLVG
jgi:hypothetical protein